MQTETIVNLTRKIPDGNVKNEMISLYLSIVETDSLPSCWEVHANYNFFFYEQIQDKYLTTRDADESAKRFSEMKTTWGFAQLIPLAVFKDSSNGYLVNDSCAFGAEVLVIGPSKGNLETLSFSKGRFIEDAIFTWEINNFSKLNEYLHRSKVFTTGGIRWYTNHYLFL
ncbi:hypothetical protein TIFTF001_025503 [Ficus carica]|uniref:MATH domain-containing protein n=1 Tax=Ficus carica TaxID=3494 RepID=A0AA88AWX0_FICCA|nr:hypothetical protein TIFTF001_025503 [Ficus carica]